MARGTKDQPELRWPSFRKPPVILIEGHSEERGPDGLYDWRVLMVSDRLRFAHHIRGADKADVLQKAQKFLADLERKHR